MRINLIATLRFNWTLLPWRQAWRLPVVIEGKVRMYIGPEARLLLPEGMSYRSIVIGSRHETYQAEAGKAQLTLMGTWEARGCLHLGVDSCLYVHPRATFVTGDGIYIARDSQIECSERIVLGDHVLAGEIYLCDNAGHEVSHGDILQPMHKPISIGHDCYFGFRTMVLRGATIPPYCVIGSGAVCTRDFAAENPKGHLFLAGVPAMVKAVDVTPDCHV